MKNYKMEKKQRISRFVTVVKIFSVDGSVGRMAFKGLSDESGLCGVPWQ